MNPKLANLSGLYAIHDWHYDRSDDHSVWSRGNALWQAICEEERKLLLEGVSPADIQSIKPQLNQGAP